MNRSEDEKLADIMVGEAVLALLNNGRRVSASTLLTQLQQIATQESDEERQSACSRAIADVNNSISASHNTTSVNVRDGNNVSHVFNNDGPADDAKIH